VSLEEACSCKKNSLGTSDKYNLPIYTLRLPFQRIYIINSTDLIPMVQRQFRILDFAPLEAKAAMNVMGATAAARKILVRDGFRYPILFDKAIHPAVTPGPKLDALNAAVIKEVSKAIDALIDQAPKTLKLYEWIRKQITATTTEAVYGPKNPFRSDSLQAAYW
jgi:hypothetical protein